MCSVVRGSTSQEAMACPHSEAAQSVGWIFSSGVRAGHDSGARTRAHSATQKTEAELLQSNFKRSFGQSQVAEQ